MNDVKRALVFWPAFTSALIVLLSLLAPVDGKSWNQIGGNLMSKARSLIGTAAPSRGALERDFASTPSARETPAAEINEPNPIELAPVELEPMENLEPSFAGGELHTIKPESNLALNGVGLNLPESDGELDDLNEPTLTLPNLASDRDKTDLTESVERAPSEVIDMPTPERISNLQSPVAYDLLDGERLATPDPTKIIESLSMPELNDASEPVQSSAKPEKTEPVVDTDTTFELLFDTKSSLGSDKQPLENETKAQKLEPALQLETVDLAEAQPDDDIKEVAKAVIAEPELAVVATEAKREPEPQLSSQPPISTSPPIGTATPEPKQLGETATPNRIVIVLPPIKTRRTEPIVESMPEPSTDQPALATQAIEPVVDSVPRVAMKVEKPKPSAMVRSKEPAEAQKSNQGDSTQSASTPSRFAQDNPASWPTTTRLDQQLSKLIESESLPSGINPAFNPQMSFTPGTWAQHVQSNLEALRELPRLGDYRSSEIIERLRVLCLAGFRQAEQAANRQQQVDWLTAAHAVNRRVAIWSLVYEIVHEASEYASDDQHQITTDREIQSYVRLLENELSETGDSSAWAEYLMLSQIDEATTTHKTDRSLLAQRFLSRVDWHGLSPEHRNWLNRESVAQLRDALKPWARAPIDYVALLNQIESQEADSIDLSAIDIAGAAQTLRFMGSPVAGKLAQQIDVHYRNANIRTAISEALLQRMLPEVEPQRLPVRTTMLGSRVRGVSEVTSDLELDLHAAPNFWSMTLETAGDIETQSLSRRDNTSISTRRKSDYQANTPIQITTNGISLGESNIDVSGNTRLRGIRTGYERWPLIGSLVQSIALAKFRDSYGAISRISNRRVKSQIDTELDKQLNQKVDKLSAMMNDMVMGPFSQLQLSPQVVDMQSSDDRLVARYRLAGDWQIGAFTPRPRAPRDNLISLQINQSAINNTLERVVPAGEPTTIHETFDRTMKLFGQENVSLPEDIPTDVSIQFAKTRPITIEIKDGAVWMTLRVIELSREKGGKLKRFIVRAEYRPQVTGLSAKLVRDGHLRISGPGMSMRQRLPIRAIFNKVLSPNQPIPLTTTGLVENPALAKAEISQMELRDGWIAIAISDRGSRIANQPSTRSAR